MQTLRPYQQAGIARVFARFREGKRAVCLVAPTGSGKTTIFSSMIARGVDQGRRVVVCVHRRELAEQACQRLGEFGVPYGMIVAGLPAVPYAPVQVATVQTLIRRPFPPADLVVCDEAHLSTADTWSTVLAAYPNARILGVTATPWRLSGKPLAETYDALEVVATPAELREQGFLSDYTGFSYRAPDLSAVPKVGGEYNAAAAGEAMSARGIVDSVVEEWLRHASDLTTIVFATTIEHSRQLTESFRLAGVAAEHLDGSTPLDARAAIFRRLHSGETEVLCNVGVAVEGVDVPRAKCIVLARPTASLARALQMMGRGRRPWGGLVTRIHDHAFVITEHGLPDEDRDYTLEGKAAAPPSLRTCSVCLAIFKGDRCPLCGAEPVVKPRGERELNTVDGAEQVEFDSSSTRPIPISWSKVSPGRVFEGELVEHARRARSFGQQSVWYVRAGGRLYSMDGAHQLDKRLDGVPIGSLVRITYEGKSTPVNDRYHHRFRVERGSTDGT